MITYVMPIFVKGQFVAVAGVDIDFNVLCDVVGAMKADRLFPSRWQRH